MIEVYKLLTNT